MVDGHFYAVYLANNQFGIGFLIPGEVSIAELCLREDINNNLYYLLEQGLPGGRQAQIFSFSHQPERDFLPGMSFQW